MKKILILVMAMGLLVWSVSSVVGTEKIIIKCTHNGNAAHPFQRGYETFKQVLEAETKGAVEVQIFPSEQLGTEEQCAQMIKLGTLDVNINGTGGLAGFVPSIELYNLPFIFRDFQHMYRVLDGSIGQKISKDIETNLDGIFLGYLNSGVRNAWNSKRPIRTPEDLKGLKIRVMNSPIFVETWNTLGAQATPMAFGELYSALQQKVVDGAECDLVDILVEKFYEVTKYVSFTKHMFLPATMVFSKKRYDRLPADVQKAVMKAARNSVPVERKALETLTDEALVQLKQKGLEFFDVNQKLFQDKVQPVYEKYGERVGGMELIKQVAKQ